MAAITTAVALGVTAAVSVAGAVQDKKAAKRKGKLIGEETAEAIDLKENEINRFQGEQTTAFAKSGVLLEGTPLEVLEQTRTEGEKQKDQIARAGKAGQRAAKDAGRAAVLNGIGAVAGAVNGSVSAFGRGK